MLAELKIENFALIERLAIEFGSGLNIITGETGAGKSIILSALSLILGERATEGLIRDGCDYMAVEAIFFRVNARLSGIFEKFNLPGIDEESLVVKREVKRNGRNRCFVNNQTVTLTVLKEIGDLLVDLHGQHEHQSLLNTDNQRQILDTFGNNDDLLKQVKNAYRNYRAILNERKNLKEEITQFSEQQNFYQHQLNELLSLNLKANEEEELLKESKMLSHTEKLAELVANVDQYFSENDAAFNILTALGAIRKNLEEISLVKTEFSPLIEKLKQAQESLEEVSQQTESFSSALTFNPQRLEAVESRLATLQRFQKQYNRTTEALIAYKQELTEKLDDLSSFKKQEADLASKGKQEKDQLETLLLQLSKARLRAKTQLEIDLLAVAKQLSLSAARFEVTLKKTETAKGFTIRDGKTYHLTPDGLERVEFQFSANPGVALKPLAKVASGGEISRLMLALKTVIASEDLIPSLIFDEIDVGIGGQVGLVVGEKLAEISARHQVMVITHLPQIASRAAQHFRVEKITSSGIPQIQIRQLDSEERISELARMLGGKESSELARKHAQELIAHD